MDESFNYTKRTISQNALLAHPDFTKPFEIYTDASDFQLGSVLIQNDHPLAFYSRKLTPMQRDCTVGER